MSARPHPAAFAGVAKLLPLLASDQDGEVLATARAIGRKLASAGLDLNDLARALTAPAAPHPGPGPYTPRPAHWTEPQRSSPMSKLSPLVARQFVKVIRASKSFGTLSPFELTIFEVIETLTEEGFTLTVQQERNLMDLHLKMMSGGVKR